MKHLPAYCLCFISVVCQPALASDAPVVAYREMCDASAAVALDKDHFIVGDDELNVLRVYKRGEPASVRQIDLAKFLGTKADKESDIEGAARVDDTIFWISSHGTNSKGEVQDRRRRLFATKIVAGVPPTVQPLGSPYTKLVQDLASDPKLAKYGLGDAATKPPKTKGALNIEGLADDGKGGLLIGFRNPLPGNRALVVPLQNPTELIQGKAAARFGAPIEIDLDGTGIRSLERVGNSYLIVSGPYDADGKFALRRWSDKQPDQPERIDVSSLGGLFPEALFSIDETGEIQILSDDGKFQVAGGDCKDAARSQQAFRSITLKP